jgi:hypothetical protein
MYVFSENCPKTKIAQPAKIRPIWSPCFRRYNWVCPVTKLTEDEPTFWRLISWDCNSHLPHLALAWSIINWQLETIPGRLMVSIREPILRFLNLQLQR